MKIKYINMENNKENITTVSVYREHYKLCILETYLNGDAKLESLVSNIIDYSMQKQRNLFLDVFNELKNIINNENLFNKIIEISMSIVNQIPYQFTMQINDSNVKYIQYLKKSLLPLF
jgi:adenine-specific DNA methylase